MSMTVILFGGSFDPIHNGHLHVAKGALRQLNAQQCWLIPAFDAPLKDRVLTSFDHRLKMISLAIEGHSDLQSCDIEASLPTPNYTITTLLTLTEKYPDIRFILLIGADQAADFHRWKDPDRIRSMAEIAVYPREGYEIPQGFTKLDLPCYPVSSTDIRVGKSVDTDHKVLRYMMMHNLYTETIVSSMISEKRMNHVRRVTDLTRRLAIRYGIDAERAVLAGLFHDAVKQWPKDQLLLWMRRYRPQLISLDPQIWHSYVAADMLKHKYYVRDKAVLQAVAHHVQGCSDQMLAKILYIADKIEPGRKYDTRVLIDLAFRDIHRTMRIVKANQTEYLGKERMNDTDGNHH